MDYAVVDSSGLIVNVVVFNGVDAWNPPEGEASIKIPEGSGVAIGWSYVNDEFVPPPQPPVESDEQPEA